MPSGNVERARNSTVAAAPAWKPSSAAPISAARAVMDQKIAALCRADIGGDHQQLNDVKTKHLGVTFKHLLLPAWHSSYHYRDRLFHIVINARTGEVQGQRPISWAKVAFAILGSAALIAAIAAVISAFQR